MEEHEPFMQLALEQAGLARAAGEVPVGAVVVLDGEVVGRGHNASVLRTDPTAHAEVVALRDAAVRVGNYRLVGATLYCTVEPCLMCFGAAMLARVSEVVYGAADPKVGAASQLESLWDEGAGFNHRIRTRGGVLAEPAATLLRDFFRERRPSAGNDAEAAAG
jgi:tRNA(adenine34) deaminase